MKELSTFTMEEGNVFQNINKNGAYTQNYFLTSNPTLISIVKGKTHIFSAYSCSAWSLRSKLNGELNQFSVFRDLKGHTSNYSLFISILYTSICV